MSGCRNSMTRTMTAVSGRTVMARKRRKSKRYTLVGVDGNAFCVMAYVKDALDDTGHGELVKEYLDRAMSSDYNNLLAVSCKYIAIVNGGM